MGTIGIKLGVPSLMSIGEKLIMFLYETITSLYEVVKGSLRPGKVVKVVANSLEHDRILEPSPIIAPTLKETKSERSVIVSTGGRNVIEHEPDTPELEWVLVLTIDWIPLKCQLRVQWGQVPVTWFKGSVGLAQRDQIKGLASQD
ncbi:hypothetical protein F5148DRAFT_1152394 [Russula earlei]|uniref:Uncharacterized protein n=1 Tax=Russula earlei TaxID=71964 RepID=A0ACC0TWL1_9AGAM|nr:hypothetical protein F5148DRAFT_1152394 [Russula earlei]